MAKKQPQKPEFNSPKDEPLEAVTTFVKWEGEIIAYFRAYRQKGEKDFTKTKPVLKNGWMEPKCRYWALEGYVHTGQHGEFDEGILRRCIQSGRLATPEEYEPLKRELESNYAYIIYPHQRGKVKTKGKWYARPQS